MTCPSCSDHGLCVIVYEDNTRVFAVCLCPVGERWRSTQTVQNHSGEIGHASRTDPLWHLWAHQNGVPLENVRMLEDAVTPAELAARGFLELGPADAMTAIAAAARNRKVSR